jgi:hypothetical protein
MFSSVAHGGICISESRTGRVKRARNVLGEMVERNGLQQAAHGAIGGKDKRDWGGRRIIACGLTSDCG